MKQINNDAINTAFKDMINSLPSKFIIVNKTLQILELNYLAKKSLSLDLSAVLKKSVTQLFPFLIPYEEKLNAVFTQNKQLALFKVQSVSSTGIKYFYNIFASPVTHTNEPKVAIRMDDISHEVQLEEKIFQNEKLASIGMLTARVAHEISAPINQVALTIEPLKRTLNQLLSLLYAYSTITLTDNPVQMLEKAKKIRPSINLDSIVKETALSLTHIKDETEKISLIVKNLKSVNRMDEETFKKTDIEELMGFKKVNPPQT